MKHGKWALLVIGIVLIMYSSAWGQADPRAWNRLCLHNGSDYYINNREGQPNNGMGKFYPKYTHIPATGWGTPGSYTYPWKIWGWAWSGMKANNGTSNYYWNTTLQAIYDNPYNFNPVPSVHMSCTFPAPVAYYTGAVPTAGWQHPWWHYGSSGLPSSLPYVGGKDLNFPSSSTWTSAVNIFAVGGATWTGINVSPYYSYLFGWVITSGDPWTVPSSASIWQWVWNEAPPWGGGDYHYLTFSGNEMDHNAGYPYNSVVDRPGYKGKNHMLLRREPYIVNWLPKNGGERHSPAYCLFVEDACLTPVNTGTLPASDPYSPFYPLGFDVATTCQTPLVTGGGNGLQIMIEDYATDTTSPYSDTMDYILLGSRAHGTIPYDNGVHRLPCAWDGITQFFVDHIFNWYTTVAYPYPTCMWGGNSAIGGNSARIPIGAFYSTWLPGKEFIMTGFPIVSGQDCTAGFMTTWF